MREKIPSISRDILHASQNFPRYDLFYRNDGICINVHSFSSFYRYHARSSLVLIHLNLMQASFKTSAKSQKKTVSVWIRRRCVAKPSVCVSNFFRVSSKFTEPWYRFRLRRTWLHGSCLDMHSQLPWYPTSVAVSPDIRDRSHQARYLVANRPASSQSHHQRNSPSLSSIPVGLPTKHCTRR